MNKHNGNIIHYKQTEHRSVVDVDTKSRKVTGYFASFNTVDSYRDMIHRGAFSKSINEYGKQGKDLIFHLYQHNQDQVLGKPDLLEERDLGLYFESTVVDTTLGLDVIKLYEAGVLSQHSIGFSYIQDKIKYDEQNDLYNIYEVKLMEGSTVTWGANENTPFTGFKTKQEAQDRYFDEVRSCLKALKTNGLTDETYRNFEIRLKKMYNLLETLAEPSIKDTLVEPTIVTQSVNYDVLLNLLKTQNNGK
jgi:HK97 family phage prohead protease